MIGETLSHYRVLEALGSGGMGEVFLAEDVRLGRQVALKLLPEEMAQSPERLARLDREARTLARLRHPAIVTLYEIEEHEGRSFLVMELVEGQSLDRLIPENGLPPARILELAIPVADALVAAHEAGVIHRDLKPGNVLVGADGTVKVCDFGLASLRPDETTPEESTATFTKSGIVVGTLPYMAPEQLRGVRHDARSDLFSFGVMLYEMAVGERPFQGESRIDLASEILHHEPPSASDLRPELPADLGRIVSHCLQKDPDRRYQTAKGLRSELLELSEGLRTGGAGRSRRELRRERRGGRVAAILAALLVAAALGLVVWSTAEPEASKGSALDDPRARALLEQATTYERRGDSRRDLEHAEGVLRRALGLEPENPYLEARLAALLSRVQAQYPREGRSEEIESLATSALARDADLAPAWVARSQLAMLSGEWERAEAAARRAIAIDQSLTSAYGLLGEALLALGRTDQAVAEATKALAIEDEEVWGRLGLAKVLLKAGRYNEAAAQYEKVLDIAPHSPNARSNLGYVYVVTGRELEAVPLLRDALREHPDDAIATNLGYALYNLGRYEAAAEAFTEAHELMPDSPSHERNLADTYEALGNEEEMRRWLEQALEDYDRALRSGGAQPHLLAERAVAAAKLGRIEEARRNVSSALGQSSNDATILFYAAQVAALGGDRDGLRSRMRETLAAGGPRDPFQSDSAFAAYREEPWFSEVLLAPDP